MVDRFRLLFGPYSTPPIRLSQIVADEVRDRDVIVVAISDGRIAWPIGKPRGESRAGHGRGSKESLGKGEGSCASGEDRRDKAWKEETAFGDQEVDPSKDGNQGQ